MPTPAKEVVDAMNAKAGLIWQWGALDFAGGTVVHINAAVAGLVGAFMIGKRVGYGKESMTPHSLTLTMVGASLLWVGWFGFNAGSALEAGNSAVLAFINTFSATAVAVLAWCVGEVADEGQGLDAGCRIGCGGGSGGDHAGGRQRRPDGCAGGRLRRRLRLPVGRQRPEEAARRRRLARRVRRARCRRHRRRAADRRVQHARRWAARAWSPTGSRRRWARTASSTRSWIQAQGGGRDDRLVGRGLARRPTRSST